MVLVSVAARRLAAKYGVDLEEIRGLDPGPFISVDTVRRVLLHQHGGANGTLEAVVRGHRGGESGVRRPSAAVLQTVPNNAVAYKVKGLDEAERVGCGERGVTVPVQGMPGEQKSMDAGASSSVAAIMAPSTAIVAATQPLGVAPERRRGKRTDRVDLTSEEALSQAAAEGLALVRSRAKTGYKGIIYDPVYNHHKRSRPYIAYGPGKKRACLGRFATAEEAALSYARFVGPDRAALEDSASGG
uniref:AP2/ERF domain-containing protein n=1 Tax=Coccolithus braarudii TaxID=221442 RepID=A0A7S0L8X7_9EUKA|mmetsp:Transcript_24076/g.51916  ORF Transcript_24076/g.51916 Transcript_24076/m.51916 type:complete len:244 (+) Transcript_24076:124-855(+)